MRASTPTNRSLLPLSSIILVAFLAAACEQPESPTAAADALLSASDAALQSPQANRAPQADREFYVARVGPAGDTRVRGTAQFQIVGDWFTAKVRVTGLVPGERVPQHIHVNATCAGPGPPLINLDEDLTVDGEGPIAGEAFPRANRAGVLQYDARRSLADLDAALQTHAGIGLDDLDLDERNVNFHEPALPVLGCGEIVRIN